MGNLQENPLETGGNCMKPKGICVPNVCFFFVVLLGSNVGKVTVNHPYRDGLYKPFVVWGWLTIASLTYLVGGLNPSEKY